MAKKRKKAAKKKVAKKKVLRKKSTSDIAPELSIQNKTLGVPRGLIAKEIVLAGTYFNVAYVHYTQREFILDFVSSVAGTDVLVCRSITSPQHIKALYKVLGGQIEKYEEANGEIKGASKTT